MKKAILISLGICFITGGAFLMIYAYAGSSVGTGSARHLLSVDPIKPETLSKFRHTKWLKPSKRIRPFNTRYQSLENCKILKYRRYSRPRLLFWLIYYEAQYIKPDGNIVTGPAFGPLPFVAPNLFLIIPLILAGIIMFITGIVLKTGKITEST